MLGLSRDITERKRVEDALLVQLDQLSTIFDSMKAVVYVADMETFELLFMNAYGARAFGADCVGKPCFQALQLGQTGPCPSCTNSRLVRDGIPQPPHVWEFRHPVTGRWTLCIDRAMHWTDGRLVRMAIGVDITKRKRAEDALQGHVHFLQMLIDAVPTPIWYKDAAGVYLGCNAAFEAAMGLTKEQVVGKTVYDLAPRELADAYHAADEELFQRGSVQVYEPHVQYADGTGHDVIAHKATFQNPDGSPGGLVGAMLDITERKRVEEERERLLVEAEQAHQRLQEFLGMVSHDLRQPLTALTGMADWLHRVLSQKALERESTGAASVLKSARRMNSMIQDLVESVRLESGGLERHAVPTDLVQLVADIAQRAGSLADWARIRVEAPDRITPVAVDPDRIERAIVNLITNALKYSPPDAPVVVRIVPSADEVVVSVTDQGVGIPSEDLPLLFERFYRAKTGRKVEGLGLGLYITRLIVEVHGGRIWVESEVGQGSTFSFALPPA